MAVPTDTGSLIEGAKCYDCIPVGMRDATMIYLLNQAMDTPESVSDLMENSKCYECIPDGMRKAVLIYLLTKLLF